MKKKIILIIGIVIGLLLIVYYGFIRDGKDVVKSVKVVRGDIIQEVSEIGQIRAQEELNLGFESSGKISEIYVKVGDVVEKNQALAKLDTSQIVIQLNEAQANLEMARSQYNKLLAGATLEEIQLAKTKVANAQNSLEDAERKLENAKKKADIALRTVYNSALSAVQKSVNIARSAILTLTDIQYSNLTDSSDYSVRVRVTDAKKEAIYSLFDVENGDWYTTEDISKLEGGVFGRVKVATVDSPYEELDLMLSDTLRSLQKTKTAIEAVRVISGLTSTEKTNISTEESNINTEIITVSGEITTIETQKSTNDTNILLAEEELNKAKNSLLIAKDELSLKKAGPSQEDISLYQAQVKQAEAKLLLLQDQFQKSVLRSPFEGRVTKINKKAGETIQLTESIVSLISNDPFQVKVDIYEEDIVKVEIGNSVEITSPAFPGEVFMGEVVAIDPTEKLVNMVVYYETTIEFEKVPEKIKPGMTVDVIIKTLFKENVLIVPESAIQKKNNKTIVLVLNNGKTEEKEVNVGLLGRDYEREIISGVEEGEEVVVL